MSVATFCQGKSGSCDGNSSLAGDVRQCAHVAHEDAIRPMSSLSFGHHSDVCTSLW